MSGGSGWGDKWLHFDIHLFDITLMDIMFRALHTLTSSFFSFVL